MCLCNPALAVALAFALQGDVAWGAAVMAMYALGYSGVLVAAFLGLRFGVLKLGQRSRRWAGWIRQFGGVALIAVGFYMLLRP